MFVVLKHIRAQRANVMQTHYLACAAPIFASVMLGHAIADRLGKRDLGVGIIHHKASLHIEDISTTEGKLLGIPCQFQGATGDIASGGSGPRENSLQPGITGDLDVSLILCIEDGKDLKDVKQVIVNMGLRLAGGKVPDPPAIFEAENLEAAIRSCGRGYWVSDATQSVRDRLKAGMTAVEAVLGQVPGGWYVPATLGYRALTRFAKRAGVRDGLDHAYCEPVVGLVRYDSVFSLFRNGAPRPVLWKHKWLNSSLFVVYQPL